MVGKGIEQRKIDGVRGVREAGSRPFGEVQFNQINFVLRD